MSVMLVGWVAVLALLPGSARMGGGGGPNARPWLWAAGRWSLRRGAWLEQ